jgi:hypothetical protein
MSVISEDTTVFTNHNVYILGAGFSADAGIPLLNNFLYEMRLSMSLLREMGRERERAAIEEVLTFRKRAASAALRVNLDVENIEDLFSLAAASSGQYASEEAVSTAIAATIDYSRRTAKPRFFEANVDHSFERPNDWQTKTNGPQRAIYEIPAYDVYSGLLSGKVCNDQPFLQNTIITFNYDTVLEESLANWKVPIWYGFDDGSVIYDDTSNHSPTNYEQSLPVLKLHGSVNWAHPNKDDTQLRVYGSYSDIVALSRQVVLVPPTWRKTFGGALTGVWNNAVKALTEATRIIMVGFSIPPTDIHFKFLMAAGLQDNISLRNIYCFNPDSSVENNLFAIVRPELRDRKTVEFIEAYTQNLVLGYDGNGQSQSSKFNRDATGILKNLILG